MTLKASLISKGFIIAGLMNMSVLIHSRLFTNATIPKFDPVVMSNFGLLMIVVWGLAYMSVYKAYPFCKWLICVFAIEKFIYGFIWVRWLLNNELTDVYKEDVMAGLFYSVYGVNDWLFCVFLHLCSLRCQKSK